MTPSEIEQASREQYNSVGDTNWSSSEIMSLIYFACLQLFSECGMVIERTFSSSTVIGTREYAFPTNATGIVRIEYNGKKLFPVTFRDDDSLTIQNSITSDTGEPQYFQIFDETIYLRPIPSAVGTLTVYAHCSPQAVTTLSTLEVPTFTHLGIVDYVTAKMAAKDQNFQMANWFMNLWDNPQTREGHIQRYKRRLRLNKRADAFAVVQTEENHPRGSLPGQ